MAGRLLICVTLLVALMPAFAGAANVAQWRLQDNAASTTVVATVGTDGTLTNAGNTSASTTTGPGGTLTAALTIDDTNDYISVTTGNTAATQNVGVLSLCAWVKPGTDTGERTMVYVQNASGTARADLSFQSNGAIRAGGRAGNAESFQSVTTSAEYDDGSWHHVLAVINYATDAITIYVDGSSVSTTGTPSFTATATTNDAATDMRIGSRLGSSTTQLNAPIADVRIYNSDESANVATIRADGVTSSTARPQVIISQLLAPQRAWQRFVSLTPIALVQ